MSSESRALARRISPAGTLPAVLHHGRASGRPPLLAAQLVFLAAYAVAWTGFAQVSPWKRADLV